MRKLLLTTTALAACCYFSNCSTSRLLFLVTTSGYGIHMKQSSNVAVQMTTEFSSDTNIAIKV